MKAWMLRNVPDELMRLFRQEARERGTSVNKAIVSLLIEKFGLEKAMKPKRHHDLDQWFGKWTREEADAFNQCVMEQRSQDKRWWDR